MLCATLSFATFHIHTYTTETTLTNLAQALQHCLEVLELRPGQHHAQAHTGTGWEGTGTERYSSTKSRKKCHICHFFGLLAG
jgi:hypothetical protein